MPNFNRRDALKMSAGFAAAAAGGFSCIELAKSGPIQVPVIDKLGVRVLVDGASDIFFKPAEVSGVKTEPGRSANSLRPLHSEWGCRCCSSRSAVIPGAPSCSITVGRRRPSTATWSC